MKKTISILLAVLTIAAGIGVAAAIAGIPEAVQQAEPVQQPLYEAYASEPAFASIEVDEPSASAVVLQLNRSGKARNEVYADIFAYLHFKEFYAPSAQDMAYLDTLITRGANLETLTEIYEFYLTTGEPITVIGQIYEVSHRFSGSYWVEEAFNYVTQNAHGVLDKDQIAAYLSERVGAEDIKIANVLSRRGTATVGQLLDRYAQGEDWGQIIAGTGGIGAHPALTGIAGQIETAQELVTANRFACVMPQDATLAAPSGEEADVFEAMRQAMEDYAIDLNGKIYAELLGEGIYPRDDEEQNAQANGRYRELAVANGMSEGQIEALLDEGYRMIDIVNASEQSKEQNATTEQILGEQRAERMAEAEVSE